MILSSTFHLKLKKTTSLKTKFACFPLLSKNNRQANMAGLCFFFHSICLSKNTELFTKCFVVLVSGILKVQKATNRPYMAVMAQAFHQKKTEVDSSMSEKKNMWGGLWRYELWFLFSKAGRLPPKL